MITCMRFSFQAVHCPRTDFKNSCGKVIGELVTLKSKCSSFTFKSCKHKLIPFIINKHLFIAALFGFSSKFKIH